MRGSRWKGGGTRDWLSRWEERRDPDMGGWEWESRWEGRRDPDIGGRDWVSRWEGKRDRIWEADIG